MKQEHKNKFSDEELIEQYKITPTLTKLAHYFGVPDITIWRRAKRLDLVFKIGGHFKKIELSEIIDGLHPSYPTFKLKNRLYKESIKKNECEICGISEWNNLPINCQLDHIDGNNHNHKLENLRIICPNCHSQTETYCGKNKANKFGKLDH